MEFGGELVLTEHGSSDSDMHQSGSRVVEPRPNFRLFLSINPSSGEVSRAMRKRCVEVCLIWSNINQIGSCSKKGTIYQRPSSIIESLHTLDCLWHAGMESAALAKVLITHPTIFDILFIHAIIIIIVIFVFGTTLVLLFMVFMIFTIPFFVRVLMMKILSTKRLYK